MPKADDTSESKNKRETKMKTIYAAIFCGIGLLSPATFAQQAPSLAVAGVQATPLLLKKYPPQAAAAAAAMPEENTRAGTIAGTWTGPHRQTSIPLNFTRADSRADPSDLPGDWEGTLVSGRVKQRLILHLARLANGNLSATLDNLDQDRPAQAPALRKGRSGLRAKVVGYQAPLLRLDWPGDGFYTGNFSPGKSSGPSLARGFSLEEVLHALDVQLADRFGAMHMFTVLEESDLRQSITVPGGQSNQVCNVKNPTIAEQYRSAGIDYLLATTVEDFEDQTLDLMQGRVDVARVDIKGSRESKEKAEGTGGSTTTRTQNKGQSVTHQEGGSSGSRQSSSSVGVSGQATAAQLDPSVQKAQSVRLEVRFKLYLAASGTVLDSATYTFQTNRTYVAVAGGSASKAASDFYQHAARNCAAWAANRITDVVFPIKVLEKSDGVITINRGEGSAVQVGQVFRIFSVGKELRDPGTGEVLGHDETTVGKVTISELHPKFSKARVLEDTGIAPGAILRRL